MAQGLKQLRDNWDNHSNRESLVINMCIKLWTDRVSDRGTLLWLKYAQEHQRVLLDLKIPPQQVETCNTICDEMKGCAIRWLSKPCLSQCGTASNSTHH